MGGAPTRAPFKIILSLIQETKMYITEVQNTYYYYRKTPKPLLPLINTTKIKRSLFTNNKLQATKDASDYTSLISKALLAIKIGIPSELIIKMLEPIRYTDKTNNTCTIKVEKLSLGPNIVEAYLNSLSISKDKIIVYRSRLTTITTILDGRDITPSLIDDVTNTLQYHTPKRGRAKYAKTPLKDLIGKEYKSEDLLGIDTINVYLLVFKALLKWAFSREYLTKDYSNLVTKLKAISKQNVRDKKDVIAPNVFNKVLKKVNPRERIFLLALKYTGMRPSELLHTNITEVDGVLCFDLRDENIQVKNINSRRIVPIHSKLIPIIDDIKEVTAKYKGVKVISRNTTKALRELDMPTTTTLYSLRHTFITNLINLGAEANIVSSLVGHSLSGNNMTVGRYFKGYDVQLLQDAINRLK